MKIKAFNLVTAAVIGFFYGGAFAGVDLVELPNSARYSETFSSVLAGVVQLPSAVITSPLNIAYRSQPLTFTNFPPESANSMIFNGLNQSEFSTAAPHSGLYADKFTGTVVVAGTSQQGKHPTQTAQPPARYAMMLATLGMMGAIVRRRHKAGAT